MNRTAYVAGKITGLSRPHVKEKFSQISDRLKGMGYHVVQPVGVTTEDHEWEDNIRYDIKKMLECDELHMLPDWQESRSAKLERDIALRLGMQVVYH